EIAAVGEVRPVVSPRAKARVEEEGRRHDAVPVEAPVWGNAVLLEDRIEIQTAARTSMRLLLATELQPLRNLVVIIELIRQLVRDAGESCYEVERPGSIDRKAGDGGSDSLAAE